jgi:hypothetical protein
MRYVPFSGHCVLAVPAAERAAQFGSYAISRIRKLRDQLRAADVRGTALDDTGPGTLGEPRVRNIEQVTVLDMGAVDMDAITTFGLFAVIAMLVFYALEDRSAWYVLAFAGACALASIYGFLQGAWPFGMVEAIWALIAIRRWQLRASTARTRMPVPDRQ